MYSDKAFTIIRNPDKQHTHLPLVSNIPRSFTIFPKVQSRYTLLFIVWSVILKTKQKKLLLAKVILCEPLTSLALDLIFNEILLR